MAEFLIVVLCLLLAWVVVKACSGPSRSQYHAVIDMTPIKKSKKKRRRSS